MKAIGKRIGHQSIRRGGFVFLLAGVSVSLSNFIYHLLVSRLLGPSAYGELGALLNLTAVATVPLAALQVAVAQSVATRPDPSSAPPLGRLLRLAAVCSLVALVLWLVATPLFDRFLHLRSSEATVVLGAWLAPSILSSVLEGVLIGQGRLKAAAMGQMVGGGAIRLLGGVLLVGVGLGVTGAVLATVLASVVVLFIYGANLRDVLFAPGRFMPRPGDAALSTVSLAGTALLSSLDAWLARHFLAPQGAGLFTAAATAGRISLFLPATIALIYFPRFAESNGRGAAARQALARATGLVGILSLSAAGIMAALPRFTVGLLFGPAFVHAGVAIGTVAAADAAIAIASCLAYYHVARRSKLALAPWLCCLLAVVLTAAFHGSLEVLALDMLVSCWALAIGLGIPTLVVALRPSSGNKRPVADQVVQADHTEIIQSFIEVGSAGAAAVLPLLED